MSDYPPPFVSHLLDSLRYAATQREPSKQYVKPRLRTLAGIALVDFLLESPRGGEDD